MSGAKDAQEQERGRPGRFSLQRILDHGVAACISDLVADDLDVIPRTFAGSGRTIFDTDGRVPMFGNLRTG